MHVTIGPSNYLVPFVWRSKGVREVGVLTNRTMSSHGSLDTQQPNNQQAHSDPPRDWILDIASRLCQIPFNVTIFAFLCVPSCFRYYVFHGYTFSNMRDHETKISTVIPSMNKSIDSYSNIRTQKWKWRKNKLSLHLNFFLFSKYSVQHLFIFQKLNCFY